MAEVAKTMSVKEFREMGYLQELNRQFLHPLGLAIEVILEDDGTERFGQVWDCRDDPEGVIYDPESIEPEKTQRVCLEMVRKFSPRCEALGYVFQPVKIGIVKES